MARASTSFTEAACCISATVAELATTDMGWRKRQRVWTTKYVSAFGDPAAPLSKRRRPAVWRPSQTRSTAADAPRRVLTRRVECSSFLRTKPSPDSLRHIAGKVLGGDSAGKVAAATVSGHGGRVQTAAMTVVDQVCSALFRDHCRKEGAGAHRSACPDPTPKFAAAPQRPESDFVTLQRVTDHYCGQAGELRHSAGQGGIPDFGDPLICGAPWRPLADPGAEIGGCPADRADAFERKRRCTLPMCEKRSEETSATSVRVRRLAKEMARLLQRQAARRSGVRIQPGDGEVRTCERR